ncbi:MAG: hypothetical protein LBD67_05300 [Candidatus Accumulibacter sp.]|jgi:hypothetical protein|nr:hypothetical protein [Accumulibacter sp.]
MFRSTKKTRRFLIAGLIASISGSVSAEVYECIKDGKRLFSDSPCPSGALVRHVPAPRPAPKPPVANGALADGGDIARTQKYTGEIGRERRLREIASEIALGEEKIRDALALMESEIAAFQEVFQRASEKPNAPQKRNLALKMRETVARCRKIFDDLKSQAAALREERKSLSTARDSDEPRKANASSRMKVRRLADIDGKIARSQAEIEHNRRLMEDETAKIQDELECMEIPYPDSAMWQLALMEGMRAISEKYQFMNDVLESRIDTLTGEKKELFQ